MKQRVKKNLTDIFDLRHAEEHYPLSRRKFQQLIHEQRLRAFQLDGKIFVKRADIEALLTANSVGADLDRMVNEVAREVSSK